MDMVSGRKYEGDLIPTMANGTYDTVTTSHNSSHYSEEQTVHLKNCRGGLGIKICGGQLKNGQFTGIFLKRTMIGGVAAEEGSLQEGDQLLQVNGHSLDGVTNEQAVIILRREAQKGSVRLVISRSSESRARFEELFGQDHSIASPSLSLSQLHSLRGNSTLSRTSSLSSTGSFESPRLGRKRSWVYNNGCMSPAPSHYDSLPNLRVGSIERGNTQEEPDDVMLPPGIGTEPQSAISRKVKAGLFAEVRSPSLSTVDSGLPSTSPYPSPGNSENDAFSSNQVQTISIAANLGLGISIYGGSNRVGGPFVYVDEVIPGCDADLDGRLKSGDLIVSINKESFTGVTYEQARAILMRLKLRSGTSSHTISFIHNPKEPVTLQEDLPARPLEEHIVPRTLSRPTVVSSVPDLTRTLTEEMEYKDLRSHSSEDALLEELTEMMSRIHSEEDTTPPTTLRTGPEGYLRNLPSRPTMTQGNQDRYHDISRSLPALTHANRGRFSPDQYSTPYTSKAPLVTSRSIEHHLSMNDLRRQENASVRSRTSDRSKRSRSRRLTLDPDTKLRLDDLEKALDYLGYDLDGEQRNRLRHRLRPDHRGAVAFGDFVTAAQEVLQASPQRNGRTLNEFSLQFAVRDMKDLERGKENTVDVKRLEELQVLKSMSLRSREDVTRLTRERDEALRESQYLREKLKEKDRSCIQLEGDLDRTRQEIATFKKESEELRNRVVLANEAQRAARITEQDNDLLIQKLEKEIASLRSNGGVNQSEFNELQKRLVVLGCQLRKAEVSKRTYEVAVDKLTKFAEIVHDNLADESRSTSGSRRGSKSGKRPKQLNTDLAKEARETVRAVKLLLEEEPLPFGWEEVYSPDGTRYYINHVTQTTSWVHPVSGVQYLPTIKEDELPTDKKL